MIEILNENEGNKNKDILQPIEIYTGLKEIRTCFRDKRTGQVISNSEQEKKFFCLKEDGKIKFYSIYGSEDSDEYYFMLSEVILEALISKQPNLKKLNHYLKIDRRFLYVVNKMLKSKSTTNYKSIILDYKSFLVNN